LYGRLKAASKAHRHSLTNEVIGGVNIPAYQHLPGEFTTQAEQLLARDPAWAAPSRWHSELRNTLAGYQRCGLLNFDQA